MDVHQERNRLDDVTKVNETDENTLPLQLTNATGTTYLHQLDEYCLLEIFSSSPLTPMDLCSLAETCPRFQQIIQRVFPMEFGVERHRWNRAIWDRRELGYKFKSKNYSRDDYTLRDVELLLKNFGSHLSTLKLDGDLDVVNLIAKYCGDVTLKRLEISRLSSIEGLRLRLDSIFRRLLKLSIYKCDLPIASADLNCGALIELEIVESSVYATILKHTFPKLERFTWAYSTIYARSINNDDIDFCLSFIRRHKRLKTITLEGMTIYSDELIHTIGSSCKELEELILRESIYVHPSTDSPSLETAFAKLKIIDLDLGYDYCSQFIPLLQASSKSIETLKLSCAGEDEVQILDVLAQLKNLRELHLTCCDEISFVPWAMLVELRKVYLNESYFDELETGVVAIIRQLTNLEELQIMYDGDIDYFTEDLYSEIVKIVERRKHVLTLKWCCYFNFIENCDDNQKLRIIKL